MPTRSSNECKIKRAVENWVRAEFQFRFGERSHTAESAEWFEDASAELRAAITGEGGLKNAASELGLKIPEWPPARRQRKRREKSKRSKPRKRLTKRKRMSGLFDD